MTITTWIVALGLVLAAGATDMAPTLDNWIATLLDPFAR
jgi:hypothetical protein